MQSAPKKHRAVPEAEGGRRADGWKVGDELGENGALLSIDIVGAEGSRNYY